MPKGSPEETFASLFNTANDEAAPQTVRDSAERAMAAWLKRHGKTRRDIQAILVKAAENERARNPPPPPPDPRDSASVRFDPGRHNPASLVENMLKLYVTMSEHVRTIYSLAIVFTHVYMRFSIAPRVAFSSKKENSGKSVGLEVGVRMMYRPNEEAMGTGAAIEEHYVQGYGSLALDEAPLAHAVATRHRMRPRPQSSRDSYQRLGRSAPFRDSG
jgi:hypothetical protein